MSPITRWRARSGRGELSCRQVAKVLQLYIDDMADPRVADRVSRHLEACRNCGLEVETYTAIKTSLNRQGVPPAEVRARLERFAETLAEPGPADDSASL